MYRTSIEPLGLKSEIITEESPGRIEVLRNPRSRYSAVWKRAKAKLKLQICLQSLTKEGLRRGRMNKEPTLPSLQSALDRSELERMPHCILHPSGGVKSIWNFILALLLMYTAIVMPFSMAFVESNGYDQWFFIDIVVDSLFFIDFVLNCVSAYYDSEGNLVSDFRKIMLNYLRSWMLLDLIACIPFGLIDGNEDSSGQSNNNINSLLRLLRVPRLYRILRITRLIKMLKHYKYLQILERIQDFFSIKQSLMRLLGSFLTILMFVHLMSCFWYFCARLEGFSPDTWVVRSNYIDSSAFSKYMASFYWAVTTITTVGYGDISAFTDLEKVLSCSWMIFGLYFFSFTIGSLASILGSLDTKENALITKLAVVDEFSSDSNLGKELRNRIKHAIRYSTEKKGNTFADKQNILNELPKSLRYEIAINMHQGAAKCIEFFMRVDPVVTATIVPLLLPIFVGKKQFVYKQNEFADEIYFVTKGKIHLVVREENHPIKTIDKGGYFGDIEVMKEIARKQSAKALSDSELLLMNKQLIQLIYYEFPKLWEEMKEIAGKKDRNNDMAKIEIEVLRNLKSENGNTVDVDDFRKMVDKRMKELHPENQNKYSQPITLESLYDSIQEIKAVLKPE